MADREKLKANDCISLYKQGAMKAEYLDDLIGRWHKDAHTDARLHEYLGLTEEEWTLFGKMSYDAAFKEVIHRRNKKID